MRRVRVLVFATALVGAASVLAPAAIASHPGEGIPAAPCKGDGHRDNTAVKQEHDTPAKNMPSHNLNVDKAGLYADQGYVAASGQTRYVEVDGQAQSVEYGSDNPQYGAHLSQSDRCVKAAGYGI